MKSETRTATGLSLPGHRSKKEREARLPSVPASFSFIGHLAMPQWYIKMTAFGLNERFAPGSMIFGVGRKNPGITKCINVLMFAALWIA